MEETGDGRDKGGITVGRNGGDGLFENEGEQG